MLVPDCGRTCASSVCRASLTKTEPQRDILLALDLSQSMDTRDFADSDGNLEARVNAVKSVVADFVTGRPTDRLGIVAFGDAPYPLAPFTMDHELVQTIIQGLLRYSRPTYSVR